jgi:carbon-monoxide dehydrogenase medium subunit/6-hydroxypseudooxynicotine dehydrogenase subunit alpha
MAFRLVRPSLLVDVDGLEGLDAIAGDGGSLRIGALVRHADLERTRLDGAWAVLAEAAGHVGHHPIRVRGTFGGSIAHADPAAELAVVAAALGAAVVARSFAEERVLAAPSFFVAPFTTALAPDEMVVEARFPPTPAGATAAFEEFAERAGDFALASACAAVARSQDRVTWARLGLGSVGGTPLRATQAEAVLLDSAGDAEAIEEAARAAARECDPASDSHASAQYRRELVAVLVRRALTRALGAAG